MNNIIQKLQNTNPEKLQRKQFLEPLASSLNIDHKRFKNRQQLSQAILHHIQHKTPENETDFATLCPIMEIPEDRLVFWNQNNKLYASDALSMKQWFDSGNFISPYALEIASGILESKNPDEYYKRFDLRNIEGFVDLVSKKVSHLQFQLDDDCVPENTKLRFQIDSYAQHMYITPILNFLEKQQPKFVMKIILNNLNILKTRILETFLVAENVPHNFTDILFVLDHIYVSVIQLHIQHPFVYILHVTECLNEVLDPSLKDIVFINFFENFNQILNI